jgi:hypothetical protein
MKLKSQLNIWCLLALIFACAGATNALATDVFTWTDEDGVVHFSDLPTDSMNSEKISVAGVYKPGTVQPPEPSASSQPESGETPLSAAQQRRERMAKEREERREAQALAEQMCTRHRQRLEQMEPARRVLYTDDSGESVRMDDDMRMGLINESKEFISKNCK